MLAIITFLALCSAGEDSDDANLAMMLPMQHYQHSPFPLFLPCCLTSLPTVLALTSPPLCYHGAALPLSLD